MYVCVVVCCSFLFSFPFPSPFCFAGWETGFTDQQLQSAIDATTLTLNHTHTHWHRERDFPLFSFRSYRSICVESIRRETCNCLTLVCLSDSDSMHIVLFVSSSYVYVPLVVCSVQPLRVLISQAIHSLSLQICSVCCVLVCSLVLSTCVSIRSPMSTRTRAAYSRENRRD